MLAYTYRKQGDFALVDKPKPVLQNPRDAIVKVTLGSICTSDLHIKHGSVPRAVPGITVGHEMVGHRGAGGRRRDRRAPRRPGGRECGNLLRGVLFLPPRLGEQLHRPRGRLGPGLPHRRRPGGVRPGCPTPTQGLTKIPDTVTDEQALLVGDVLATGYWAAQISDITPEDTVLILGAGPTGLCTLQCVQLYGPPAGHRLRQGRRPAGLCAPPPPRGAHRATRGAAGFCANRYTYVLEVAGSDETFRLAWQCARPNAIVTVVALYDAPQVLPLPEMYGKNLIFKTGGVDGCHCQETLDLIAAGKLDTTPLITHTYDLKDIEAAYDLFEHRRDGVIKVAIRC